MRRAFDEVIEKWTRNQSLPMIRLIHDTPVLYAKHLHQEVQWNEAIAQSLVPRLTKTPPGEERRLRAGALAAAGVACFAYARLEWGACDGKRSVAELLDLAMDAVSPLSGP